MSEAQDFCIVVTTFPGEASARQCALHLVEQRLVACAQVHPGLTSFYTWQGSIQQDDEVKLTLKTRTDRLVAVQQALRALHPYQVPQFIVLRAEASAAYLAWVNQVLDDTQ